MKDYTNAQTKTLVDIGDKPWQHPDEVARRRNVSQDAYKLLYGERGPKVHILTRMQESEPGYHIQQERQKFIMRFPKNICVCCTVGPDDHIEWHGWNTHQDMLQACRPGIAGENGTWWMTGVGLRPMSSFKPEHAQ
jgi:hypothetical protein